MINCQDCLTALNSYLDRELSGDDIVHVRQHLDGCGGCLHLYQFQESVQRLIRVRCLEQAAPESLRVRIAMQLAAERLRQEQRRPGTRGIRLDSTF